MPRGLFVGQLLQRPATRTNRVIDRLVGIAGPFGGYEMPRQLCQMVLDLVALIKAFQHAGNMRMHPLPADGLHLVVHGLPNQVMREQVSQIASRHLGDDAGIDRLFQVIQDPLPIGIAPGPRSPPKKTPAHTRQPS